jgi:NADH:ubiquinone oxidoreductase subunit 2 (subunit N)
MIITFGLLTSIYLIFLISPRQSNTFLARTTSMILAVSLFFDINSLQHWQGDIVFFDGLLKVNTLILVSKIYLMLIIILILQLKAIYSRRSELYLIIMTNIIGLIYLLQSNDLLITIIAWELFNLSLYLLVSFHNESEASLSAAIKYFM